MRKKIFILLVIFTNISYFCFAQSDRPKTAQELMVEFFTKELSLKPEESTKLWPVFNNYRNELATVRKESKNDQLQMEEKIVMVRKKYKTDFRTILGNDDRVNDLFVAEKVFNEMLIEELRRRSKGE